MQIDNPDEEILILAPVGRDAELAQAALEQVGIQSRICLSLRDLNALLEGPCGGALIAEEALGCSDANALIVHLSSQPAWSDIPIIILTIGRRSQTAPTWAKRFAPQGNITLLERPLRLINLQSVVEVALRARRRQYQVRDLLKGREQVLNWERSARSDAEKASRLKDEFLATLSHELRTPLNAIVGWTNILRTESMKPEELADGLEIIDRNARAQTIIIDDLLDMSRIISGKMELQFEEIQLDKLIDAAIKTVRPGATAREVALQVQVDCETSYLMGDPNRLQQVFYNLLTNAIKFTPNGGTVKVSLKCHAETVEVHIADSGIGIDPEFLPMVFDRFRQANSSTTRKYGGMGLGLAIVKNLIELHGGNVLAESDGIGHGARFSVTLPRAGKSIS